MMAKRVSSTFSIEVGDKTLRFKLPLFSDKGENSFENVEKTILSTDLNNLVGELIVAPIIMNRLGVLQAEAEEQVREQKFNYEVWEAKTINEFREAAADSGEKKPTGPECVDHILTHKLRAVKQRKLNNALKTQSYINSLYWSFKEKQENLKKLSLTLQQGDLDDFTMSRAIERLEYVTKIRRDIG